MGETEKRWFPWAGCSITLFF